jgi:hypothetical protein
MTPQDFSAPTNRAYSLETRRLGNKFHDLGREGWREGRREGRNRVVTPKRGAVDNTSYTQWVKWMKEQDKWRDPHGKSVTDITPEESIDLRVQEVYTKTKQTPISYQQTRVITV